MTTKKDDEDAIMTVAKCGQRRVAWRKSLTAGRG